MQGPLISIIVPVYNVSKYLTECLQSLMSQTYTNIDIILVDDGSTDDSGVICDHFSKNDMRVRVVHKSNAGVSAARNAGLDIALGEYVSFVDSDDVVANDMIECLYDGFVKNPDCYIVSGQYKVFIDGDTYQRENSQGNKCDLVNKEQLADYIFARKTYIFPRLYRRELLKSLRFVEGVVDEDTLFQYEIVKCLSNVSFPMCVTNSIIYYYRQRIGSAVNSTMNPIFTDRINNLELLEAKSHVEIPELSQRFAELKIASLCFWVPRMMRVKAWGKYRKTYQRKLRKTKFTDAKRVYTGKSLLLYLALKWIPSIVVPFLHINISLYGENR